MLRLTLGLKAPSEAHELRNRRVSVQLPESSSLGPLYLELATIDDGTQVGFVLTPQVRFAKKGGGFVSIREAELATTDPRSIPEIDVSRKDLFWSRQHVGAYERLKDALQRHGITFTPGKRYIPPGTAESIDLDISYTLDAAVRRGIAKISFNYLTKVTAKDYPTFVYRPEFDAIRDFILNGVGEMKQFVRPLPPVNHDFDARDRSGRHHYLVANWNSGGDEDIGGTVVLFSERAYTVRLARRPKGIWIDLRSAHDYDLERMDVTPITSARLIRPPHDRF
jgi:hypothetical protein